MAINANLTTREQESRKLYGNDWPSTINRLSKEREIIDKLMPESPTESETTVTEPKETDKKEDDNANDK